MDDISLFPLESNPDVLNKFIRLLGVPTSWSIIDVVSLDRESLTKVPHPVLAVMLLFPVTSAYENYKKKQEKQDYELKFSQCPPVISSNMFYVKQHLDNAGGTIALVHSIANNLNKIKLSEGTFKKYLQDANGLDAEAKGTLLENNYGIIGYAHMGLSREGQTYPPNAEDPMTHHFTTFVHVEGFMYELDGLRAGPVNHGPTRPECLLEDAARISKEFMNRDRNEIRFALLALVATK